MNTPRMTARKTDGRPYAGLMAERIDLGEALDDTLDPYNDTPETDWKPPKVARERPYQDVRSSAEYKALHKQFMLACRTHRNADGTYGLPCALCGKKINYRMHHLSPWAPTVDHIIPVRIRPDLILDTSNWQPAHRHCNESRERRGDDEVANLGVPSEDW